MNISISRITLGFFLLFSPLVFNIVTIATFRDLRNERCLCMQYSNYVCISSLLPHLQTYRHQLVIGYKELRSLGGQQSYLSDFPKKSIFCLFKLCMQRAFYLKEIHCKYDLNLTTTIQISHALNFQNPTSRCICSPYRKEIN